MKKKLILIVSFFITFNTFSQEKKESINILFKVKPEYKTYCSDNEILLESFKNILKKYENYNLQRMFSHIPIHHKHNFKSDISLIYKLKFISNNFKSELLLHELSNLKYLEYVEQEANYQLLYAPNDPWSDSITGNQDYLKMHKVYAAWDITKGDSTILVAVSDQGINLSHPDLINTIHKNLLDTIDGIDNDNDGLIDNYLGYDLADNDNNPSESSNHGTFVSGCVSADTDNGIGIAGIGFNTKIVPLKVYGNEFKGFESIVFAAEKGYDVINLSWGCMNCYSQLNQDIINYAVLDKNLIIVAAAGNTEADVFWYPASYDNVLSVSGLKNTFEKGNNISWNYKVDIMAKGNSVFSTSVTGGYASVSGTSFASPMVAGGAALVKSVFPNFNANQIMEQLRVTADSIYHIGANGSYRDKLGKGSLNVHRAVSDTLTPAIRNLSNYLALDAIYRNGDTIFIKGDFINYLNPTTNLTITLSSPSSFVQLIDSSITVGTITTLEQFNNANQLFSFKLKNNPTTNQRIWLKFSYNDLNYTDFEYKELIVNQDFLNIHENKLLLTVNSTGNIGYNIPNRKQGIGLSYNGSKNLLYECGLIIATDSLTVSDNLRKDFSTFNQKFYYRNVISEINSGTFSDFKAQTVFFDTTLTNDYVGVNVVENIYAWNTAPDDNYIIIEFQITNRTSDTIHNLYAGLFSDWDIDIFANDKAAWNHKKGFGYAYNVNKTIFAGIKPLYPYYGTYYAIDNELTATTTLEISNNFTNAEKFKTLSSIGKDKITAGENYKKGSGDISQTVGNKLGTFYPNQTKTIAFAIIVGNSIEELELSATAAQFKYSNPLTLSSTKPLVQDTTICKGTNALLNASGGEHYAIYFSEEDFLIMDTILPYKTTIIQDTTTFYIAFLDSVIPSQKSAIQVNTYQPKVELLFSPDTLYLLDQKTVQLLNISQNYSTWEWNYNDSIYTTAYNPIIEIAEEGFFYATLFITDAKSCSNSKIDSLWVINGKKPTSSISEERSKIKIYPNPSMNFIIVENTQTSFYTIELYNQQGQLLSTKKSNSFSTTFDISELANGIYLLKINENYVKLIKN